MDDNAKIEVAKYDLATVTADDFTVEMDISLNDYKDFLKNVYEPNKANCKDSKGIYMKKYLKFRIEDTLSRIQNRKANNKIDIDIAPRLQFQMYNGRDIIKSTIIDK